MLEQILELVKQSGQQSVVDNNDVPNTDNNAVMAEAAKTITGGLQNVISGGGLQSIVSMFTGSGQNQGQSSIMSNPIVSMMVGHLANNLVRKMNLSPAVANGISNNIIPAVMNNLINRTQSNDPANSGFNLTDLISAFTGDRNNSQSNQGGAGFDFQGLLNQFTGNGGGGSSAAPDISNILGNLTQQAQQNQQQGGGNALAGLIQGFFK
ncbi:MAG TPA: hypothetical protein PK191_10225 [Niabella sp.]|nr:hypothetical protein [Niabella sp.]HOZ98205.1 hypothetical protein [Niabella sp.]HQW16246.1 hypothetical protein [Niabella sp.]HQX21467.1 hypothetical protein [Niabella sp.]HQX42519.1 hypothetical protein [Niabella sp.]